MKIIFIKSLSEYIDFCRDLADQSNLRHANIFRGQRYSNLSLIPSIWREPLISKSKALENSGDEPIEFIVFHRFCNYAASYMPDLVNEGSPEEIAWRKLIVAQHHGLPTRLLDWSFNPLIGLYFALQGKDPQEGIFSGIHILKNKDGCTVRKLAEKNKRPPRYEYKNDVGVFVPPYINGRMIAQSSVFTIHKSPVSFAKPQITVLVKTQHRQRMRKELLSIGIDDGFVFPDLDGVARRVKTEADWLT